MQRYPKREKVLFYLRNKILRVLCSENPQSRVVFHCFHPNIVAGSGHGAPQLQVAWDQDVFL